MARAVTTTTWEMPVHTAAKHRLLRAYLDRWFPKIASWSSRLVYLDGFAGPGRYEGGDEGSPIVAMRALLEHTSFPKWSSCSFTFAFCEADAERAANLRAEIASFFAARGGQPSNVTVVTREQSFEEVGGELVGMLTRDGKALAPTLAFIDPFGFKGLPMSLLGQLLNFDACEVLVNFMLDSVNRFATGSNVAGVTAHLDDLFACSAYSNAPPAGAADRGPFLLDLYKQQLRACCRFTYVRSFEVV